MCGCGCVDVWMSVSVDRSIVYTRDEDEKEDKIDTTNWRQRRIKSTDFSRSILCPSPLADDSHSSLSRDSSVVRDLNRTSWSPCRTSFYLPKKLEEKIRKEKKITEINLDLDQSLPWPHQFDDSGRFQLVQ